MTEFNTELGATTFRKLLKDNMEGGIEFGFIEILLFFKSSSNLSFIADMWREEVPDVITKKSVKLFNFDRSKNIVFCAFISSKLIWIIFFDFLGI